MVKAHHKFPTMPIPTDVSSVVGVPKTDADRLAVYRGVLEHICDVAIGSSGGPSVGIFFSHNNGAIGMRDDADDTDKAFWSAWWSRIWGVPCDEWGDPLDPELREKWYGMRRNKPECRDDGA